MMYCMSVHFCTAKCGKYSVDSELFRDFSYNVNFTDLMHSPPQNLAKALQQKLFSLKFI